MIRCRFSCGFELWALLSPPPRPPIWAVVRSDRGCSRCSAEGWGDAASSISAAASSGAVQLRCTSYHISRPSPGTVSPSSSQQFTWTAIRHVNFLTDFNQRKEIPFAQKQQRLRRTVTKPLTLTSRAVNGTSRSFTVRRESPNLGPSSCWKLLLTLSQLGIY